MQKSEKLNEWEKKKTLKIFAQKSSMDYKKYIQILNSSQWVWYI